MAPRVAKESLATSRAASSTAFGLAPGGLAAGLGQGGARGFVFGCRLVRSLLPHSKALALGGDHSGVVRQAIEQRGGELLVTAEDLDPLGEGEVGGDDDASSLVTLGEQIEEQLAAGAVEGDEAKLVEHEKIDLLESSLQASELSSVARFEQRTDDVRRAGEENASSLTSGFDAERDRQVRLAGADGPGEDDVVCAAYPFSACELGDLRGADRTIGRRKVEGVERLHLREVRLAQTVTHGGVAT